MVKHQYQWYIVKIVGVVNKKIIMKDYFENPLEIGDEILYIGVYNHSPNFREGKITKIEEKHDVGYHNYESMLEVLGNGNTRKGWTYPNRVINKKYVLIVNGNNTDPIEKIKQ